MKSRKAHMVNTAKNASALIRGAKESEYSGDELVEVEITLKNVRKMAAPLHNSARSLSTNPESLRDVIQAQAALNNYLVGMLEDFDIRIKATELRTKANR